MNLLTQEQRQQLRDWRRQALALDHTLSCETIHDIETEVSQWSYVQGLKDHSNFFEPFDLYDATGARNGAKTWRGIAHWLWLRHGCVHGMLLTPSKLVILQRRAMSVTDSPGFLDMTFAGHMGTSALKATTASEGPQALESEAAGEVGVNLLPGSDHIVDAADLEPICQYSFIEPPRPAEDFYNIEIRYVFVIRISSKAMGEMKPIDGEVGSFVIALLEETWALLQSADIASALRVSGPMALYHTMRNWGWEV